MSEYLPREVRAGLELARKADLKKKSRINVQVGGQSFVILRHWDEGFALDKDDAPHLRGLVDIYDGARHLSRCLIVASSEDDGEMVYEYKRATPVSDSAPLDYHRDENAPVAFIGKSSL
jgi:hypothetical protein